MSRNNLNKTISCNSNGIVISYGDANKHQFIRYEKGQLHSYVKKIQLEGTVKYQKLEEEIHLNPKQRTLYNQVVYGFKAFTKEEIASMSETAKKEVMVGYTKAHRILRNWKQDLTFSFIDRLLLNLFPNSPIVKQMVETTGHIENTEDEILFKDLGITQENIIRKLIEFKLLPENFFNLV